MIQKNNKNNIPFSVQLMEFIKKYWLVITALLVGYPYLKRYLDAQKVKNVASDTMVIKETKLITNASPVVQNDRRSKITVSKELWAASAKLAHDFGFDVADKGNWYDLLRPSGMTENDVEIRNTLLKYRNYFPALEKLYYEVDTNSRSLRNDILQLLDKKELIIVRKAIKL